jgi:putative component of toxin-antitoxin plasmid stabilization module
VPNEAYRAFRDAIEARRQAHHLRRSRGPGWRIYFRMKMARALRKWKQYAEAVRADA